MLYRFPVKGELWEDIFDQVINTNSKTWNMGSHSAGADVISNTTGVRYQNKAGIISKDMITWSGHRTTKYKTLEEKIKFISDDHCDQYIMLARDTDEWKRGLKKYYLIMFDSDLIDYTKLNWKAHKNRNKTKIASWKGSAKEIPYTAKILRGTSDQLWTTAELSYLGTVHPIVIEYDTEFFEYKK